jgi:hypothetical protein
MKENYTDINIVLDRSGSMHSVKSDTIGGFDTFLSEQQSAPGEAAITLIQFDDAYESVYRAISIKEAKPLDDKTFVPRGSTALLDAIGRTIHDTGKRLESMSESDKPAKIVFVVITDGHENASKEYSTAKVNEMIQHQRDVYGWEFVFLGANQDAITSAAAIGISVANAMTYASNSAGVRTSFRALSANMASLRVGRTRSMAWSKEDRDEQKKAGAK